MNHPIKTGLSFGVTSGIITTLGLMVGLSSATYSKPAVIGGILTIAIADAFSDALGIHISEESENKHTAREIWQSTISTFLAKFLFALSFITPVLLLKLPIAILASVVWGLVALSVLSFNLARMQKIDPWKVIAEHLIIALAVVTISYFVGQWVSLMFS